MSIVEYMLSRHNIDSMFLSQTLKFNEKRSCMITVRKTSWFDPVLLAAKSEIHKKDNDIRIIIKKDNSVSGRSAM